MFSDIYRYDTLILCYSDRWARKPKATKRQIRTESNFNPLAYNSVSQCQGLMQFNNLTWRDWKDANLPPTLFPRDPFNPEWSINAGCAYMQHLEVQFGGLDKALAAYNWGPGNLRHLLDSLRPGNDWKKLIPLETQNYLAKCLDYDKEVLYGAAT